MSTSERLPAVQPMATPNPRSLKFLTDRTLVPSGSVDCQGPEEARRSPLAMRLFDLEGVTGVFLCQNFVTVTADSDGRWAALKPTVVQAMQQYLASGEPVLDEAVLASEREELGQDEGEVEAQVRHILDTQIRPAVAMDGGDIVFDRYEDGVVHLRMQGACGGCPSSTATLKMGIENRLRHLVPQVERVEAVAG